MKNSKLLTNIINLLSASMITAVFSFLCFTFLGNKMSVEDYSVFSTVIALATTAAMIVNNIISGTVINRELAIDPRVSKNLLKKSFFARLAVFILVAILLSIYANNNSEMTVIVKIALLIILAADSFWDLFEQISFGLKITKVTVLLNVSFYFLWLIIAIVMPKHLANSNNILITYSVIFILKAALYGAFDYKITRKYSDINSLKIIDLFRTSVPYLYIRVLGTLSAQLPILLLAGYSDFAQVAYYSVGEKLTTPVTKLATAALSAVFPYLTKAFKNARKATSEIVIQIFGLVMSFGACVSLILSSTSNYWLVLLMGEKYQNAVEAFNYQIWFAVILTVDSMISMVLSSDFKQKALAIITTIDVLVLLPFLYFGIKSGANGVAIAKLIFACISIIYHLILMSCICSGRLFHAGLIKGAIIFVALFIISQTSLPAKINLAIAIAALPLSIVFQLDTIRNLLSGIRKKSEFYK